ncbi:MAG TPA: L-glutamate gamma-semialdehyde dehydrogenase [Bryobacteraceae bacterium]|jgi:1-pyrroline-5-carboxylate dehydrogenase|nr:L-glutamate gamma-semialdehyde dehydrogenase [Bryobacteraceae bacterium]
MTTTAVSRPLAAFTNEPVCAFSRPEEIQAARAALKKVRAEFGREYELWIAGGRHKTGDLLSSVNPARPSEIVGRHHRANAALAAKAIEDVHAYFPEWSRTPVETRVNLVVRAASIIRERKLEFDAWLVCEAGKTWPEADADVSEAIDFCEYYARQMQRFASPPQLVQMPGERDEMVYLPLGAGIIIPPWNFPLAIMTGMSAAALVTGNTIVIKPSSETPTIAQKLAEVLLEAGFPPRSFALCTGSGSIVGDLLVEHPKTRFISFTGSRDVGLRINELAAKPRKGQIWIKRVVAEMGGKDAIIIDREADLDAAVAGVVQSAYGYQGQKCSACSRAIVDQSVYDEFLQKLQAKVAALTVGPPEEPENYMGPVISAGAKKTILDYIETGKREGRLVAGGDAAPGDGYFVQPTVIADVDSKARIFQEEIFGPVLAVTKARDFDHALALANDSEYGLTGAVYTRNPEKIRRAKDEFFVGNLYINRKCTGAMVGAHPFGGFNMSGTDSKAGGPDYLLQFLQPKSIGEKI